MTRSDSDSHETMVITGGDDWTVEELTEFLGHIYVLYNRVSVLMEDRVRTPAHLSRQMQASKRRTRHDKKMTVKSLRIQSPIQATLQGVGEIIREVREGIKDVYRNPLERKSLEQQLQHEGRMNEIELAEAKIKLLRSANQAMLEMGLSDEERQASLKALLDPAKDSADIVQRKNLEIE